MRNRQFNFVGDLHRQLGLGAGSLAQPFVFPPGSWNFTPPQGRNWKFVAWGTGSPGDNGPDFGGSGGYFEKTATLLSTAIVVIKVGGIDFGQATSVNIAGQPLCTAGSGSPGVGGVATGGDVNLNGSVNAAGLGTGGGALAAGGGAGAPGNLPFRGGSGYNSPGGGGNTSIGSACGQGLVLVFAV